MNRVKLTTIIFALVGSLAVTQAGQASVVTFINDYEGFLQAAGDVQTIGFEILPDGSPTLGGEELTSDFNYTDWGVTFSSPVPPLSLRVGALVADSYPGDDRNWIIAGFDPLATSVGVFFPPSGTLSVFDAGGGLIGSEFLVGASPTFLGIVSQTPISVATFDQGRASALITSFHYTPIPEPASLALLAFGAVALFRRRHTSRSRRS